jgi:hypothetical protein
VGGSIHRPALEWVPLTQANESWILKRRRCWWGIEIRAVKPTARQVVQPLTPTKRFVSVHRRGQTP